MLPFLKPKHKQNQGIIVETVSPEDFQEAPESNTDEGLKLAAQDLIDAVASKDVAKVAAALKAAHEMCEMAPHVEGPHEDIGEEKEE